jgi:hypothetical protein
MPLLYSSIAFVSILVKGPAAGVSHAMISSGGTLQVADSAKHVFARCATRGSFFCFLLLMCISQSKRTVLQRSVTAQELACLIGLAGRSTG